MQTWLVHLDNAVLGPMTLQELKQLSQQGALRPETRISADGQKWQPASSLPELSFSASASSPQPPRLPQLHSSAPKTIEWNAMLVGGCAAIGVLGLLLIGMCGLLALIMPVSGVTSGSNTNLSETTSSSGFYTDASQQQAVNDPVPQATYDYWEKLASWIHDAPPTKNVSDQEEYLRGLIDVLEREAVVNVDPAATQCALNLSQALRKYLAVLLESNDPSIVLEAFVRGATGDPFGKAQEMAAKTKDAQRELSDALHRSVLVRAELSQRYGVEFTPWNR